MSPKPELLFNYCMWCGDDVAPARWALGYRTCMVCGERDAKEVRHTVVPMNKSNYMLFTDPQLLKQLNPKRTT